MNLFRGLAISLLVVAACGGSNNTSVVDQTKYARTCTTATDCAAGAGGDVCACVCEFFAVNKSEQSRLGNDRAQIDREECGSSTASCGACQQPNSVACNAGTCIIQQ